MSVFPKDPGPSDYGACFWELKTFHDRCRALQVPVELERPQKILPKTGLAHRLAENSLLLTLVEQVITPHHYAGPQKDHIYILCDPELVALKIFAAPEVLAAAEDTAIKPGTVFTKGSCGTNALALARKHKRIVAIRGEQHYCALFKDWWCVAGAVKDPAGNTLGYLDISIHAEKELGFAVCFLENLLVSLTKELYIRDLEQILHQSVKRMPASHSLPPEIERELTRREREVLLLRLSGLTTAKIAKELCIGVSTVKTHCEHIYKKLGVNKLPELFSRFGR